MLLNLVGFDSLDKASNTIAHNVRSCGLALIQLSGNGVSNCYCSVGLVLLAICLRIAPRG